MNDPARGVIVFVGGCDRSGTTVVGRILAEQLSLVALPEAYFHAVAFRRFGPDVTARRALRHWRRRSWGLDAGAAGRDDALSDYLRRQMQVLHDGRRGHGPLRVVESTPENIEIGSILLDRFPDAHVVHVVRDPRGVAASLRGVDFGPRSAQECARLWKQRCASGLALESLFAGRVHRVRYEDLIESPGGLGSLRSTVGVDGDHDFDLIRDVMLDFSSVDVQSRATGSLDRERVASWRTELSIAQIGAIEYECRELMRLFDYPLEGYPDGRRSSRRRLDTLRSAAGDLTIGTARRAWRVGRARLRPPSADDGQSSMAP